MPEYKALPLFLISLAAIAAWAVVRRWGGRRWRRHAVEASGVVLFIGIDRYYDLPWYAYILALVIASALYHWNVRGSLEEVCKAIGPIPLPELGLRLQRIPNVFPVTGSIPGMTPSGGKWPGFVALWGAEPIVRPVPPNPNAPPVFTVALQYVQEDEDEYGIILLGEVPKELPIELVIHHRDGQGRFTRFLEHSQLITGLPGQEVRFAIRCSPKDFAFKLFGKEAFAILGPLFNLRSEDREVFVHVEGRHVRVCSSRTFGPEELKVFVAMGARWIYGLRAAAEQLGRAS
ncbi:MAG: hypothetical protein HY078_11235 [Elusimicrobia bacterium]|nr:hypothetical protein [Elusimicrobiota bacterium]